MTTVRQMFALQELDIILDRVQVEHAKAEYELNNGDEVHTLESELERDAEWLQETELQQKASKLEAATQKERSETLNCTAERSPTPETWKAWNAKPLMSSKWSNSKKLHFPRLPGRSKKPRPSAPS